MIHTPLCALIAAIDKLPEPTSYPCASIVVDGLRFYLRRKSHDVWLFEGVIVADGPRLTGSTKSTTSTYSQTPPGLSIVTGGHKNSSSASPGVQAVSQLGHPSAESPADSTPKTAAESKDPPPAPKARQKAPVASVEPRSVPAAPKPKPKPIVAAPAFRGSAYTIEGFEQKVMCRYTPALDPKDGCIEALDPRDGQVKRMERVGQARMLKDGMAALVAELLSGKTTADPAPVTKEAAAELATVGADR